METLQAVASIVLIDLTLSGDNALVIGMAARTLPPRQRRAAIVLGGAMAVSLRIVATAAVVVLLQIPLLQFAGGLVLVAIAYRLARPASGNGREVRAGSSLREAVLTIVVADAAMSLENVLGVGAAAHGHVALLVFGLALSIPIVLFGSGLVVALLERFPGGIWLGVLALVWTAAELMLDDPFVPTRLTLPWLSEASLALALLGAVAIGRLALRPRPRSASEGARFPR